MSDAPKISSEVKKISLVSYFTDVASDMIFPVLPTFLRNSLGLNEAAIGLIDGVANASTEIIKVFAGRVSDYLGKRKMVIFVGYALSSISKTLFYNITTPLLALILRVSDRIGKGIRTTPRDALLVEHSQKKTIGTVFGFQRALDTLGGMTGSIILILLLNTTKIEIKNIFLISFIPSLIALLILVFLVKEIPVPKNKNNIKLRLFDFKIIKIFPKKYFLFLFITALFSLGNISYSFLILKANDLKIPESQIPILYFFYTTLQVIVSYFSGTISDKKGKVFTLVIGYLFFGLMAISAIFSQNLILLLIMFASFGIFLGINTGIGKVIVANFSPLEYKATAMGLYQTAIGIVTLFANVIFGILYSSFGSNLAFCYSLIITLITLLTMYLLRPKLKL